MSESEAKSHQPERKFNQEQYDMLIRCSEKKDMTEWNKWREANLTEEIWLEGAVFRGAYREGDIPEGPILKGAVLSVGPNPEVLFWGARVEGAELWEAHLEGANLRGAHLEGAILRDAHLEGADLRKAHLKGAKLAWAHLEGAKLWYAHLEGAELNGAHLEGAELDGAQLERADFSTAIVDGKTLIRDCEIDRETDFTIVGLDSARVEPGLKQSLEYNIRRKRWQEWYKEHPLLRWPVRFFWLMSDYGRSTGWIAIWFFAFAFAFAVIYCRRPHLLALTQGGEIRGFFHALYFSVVTMTTLGFGDIHANPDSGLGQALLMVQVILGYVLLGALITRFAVLFTAGGPAAKFADEKTIRQRLAQLLRGCEKLIRRRSRTGRTEQNR